MVYDKTTLKKLHEVELDILSTVITLCEKNRITYFTLGGTTLGAYRRGGMISWDDDIDIGMLRADYDRFILAAKESLPDGYFLQHYSTEPDCATYFAKVRKDGTRFVEDYVRKLPVHHGIYIDIKPLDYCPADETSFRKYRRRNKIAEQLFLSKRLWRTGKYHSSTLKYLIRSAVRWALHILLLPVSRDRLYRKLEESLTAYNTKESTYVSFRAEAKTYGKTEDFLPVQKCPFDHLTVCIPNNPDPILRNQFGDDYMTEKKPERSGHQPVELSFGS